MSPSRGEDGDWQCVDPSDSGSDSCPFHATPRSILRSMWLSVALELGSLHGGTDGEGGHWEGWYPNLAVIYIKVLGWLEVGETLNLGRMAGGH